MRTFLLSFLILVTPGAFSAANPNTVLEECRLAWYVLSNDPLESSKVASMGMFVTLYDTDEAGRSSERLSAS